MSLRKAIARRWCGQQRRSAWVWLLVALTAALGGCRKATLPAPALRLAVARELLHLDLGPVKTAARSGDRLAVGLADGRIAIVDLRTATMQTLATASTATTTRADAGVTVDATGAIASAAEAAHDGAITALAFSADGHHLLSAGGKAIIWWQLDPGPPRLLGQLRGPRAITAAALDASGRAAYFGTADGYLERWRLDRHDADAVSGARCEVLPVERSRRRQPPERRCPYGTYLETPRGESVCFYPITHLARRGTQLAIACRTGTLIVLDLHTRRLRHAMAGALAALAWDDDQTLIFARLDGSIRRYDLASQQTRATFVQGARPTAVAAAGSVLAVADVRRHLRLWRLDNPEAPPAEATLRHPAAWLALPPHASELLAIETSGRSIRFRFEPLPRDKKTTRPRD